MFRSMLFTALLTMTLPLAVLAQTADDLKNDEKTTGDVLVYGMGYSANRFSSLTQINKDNVAKLVPVWAYSLADLQGGEGFPVVKGGVIYVTTHNATAAVDAMTGKQIWRVFHDYPPESLRVVPEPWMAMKQEGADSDRRSGGDGDSRDAVVTEGATPDDPGRRIQSQGLVEQGFGQLRCVGSVGVEGVLPFRVDARMLHQQDPCPRQ